MFIILQRTDSYMHSYFLKTNETGSHFQILMNVLINLVYILAF